MAAAGATTELAPAAATRQLSVSHVFTPRAVAPVVPSPSHCARPAEPLAPAAGSRPGNLFNSAAMGYAWLIDYTVAASRAMRAAAGSLHAMQPDTVARITLPGPALPSELLSLSQAGLSAIPGFPRRQASATGLPGWLVSLSVMGLLLFGGVGLLSYFVPNLLSNSVASADPSGDARITEVHPSTYPLAKFVEVTGFRFVVDLNRRSEIHYLVVNHSAAQLNGVNVFVTLRQGGAKSGQPPLCRFSFHAPEMAPFESKEMTSSIDKLTRTVALPDWQELRAEVEIGQ